MGTHEDDELIGTDGVDVIGTIYSIGVQTDAESGTVQVKVELDNSEGKLRGGEQCYLTFQ